MEEDILIERYFKEELSAIEKAVFKKRLEADIEFRIKVDFEKELFNSYNNDSWDFSIDESENIDEIESFFKDVEIKKIKETIKEGNNAFKKKKKAKERFFYFISIAASIALLVGLFWFSNSEFESSYDVLYSEYIKQTKLPGFVNRGENDAMVNLVEAEKSFKNREFKIALKGFNENLQKDKKNSTVYVYCAISYIELEEYVNADQILDSLISSDLIDSQKGYWIKSLSLVKQNKLEEAKVVLNFIIDKAYYNKEKAKELLSKLDN
ncbi:hypothetical protein PG911_14870 [Tenacibaculum ovolyticum]|uniref:hypothetical protein n=1 Tax=Tenacibaculum ovolyticum TaxID=104270 RepID=UPI0022F3D9CD|nr:hypothetical protein [Tenacibaculum ovolyticum]WBX75913.1 hypothetical protein PG911_14870 [Tenacibaculum ovolyticum]